ncbi:MAG: tetratricopeptide repeat protein [Treponema sp.]|nr:tetratricopeptide repeat protein [Treponema sp.]
MDEKEIVFNRAKNAMLSRDFTLAARLFKSLLADDPNNLELLNSLGQLYIKASDDEKALPFYEKIIKLNPVNVDAYNNMGGIYRRLKRYDESIAILNKALSFNKNNSEVKYNLGFTYKLMGKNDEACDCFEYVISENPNDVLAYNHLGSIYATKKDYQKSISIYKRGLQVDPNHPILQYNLARSYVATNSDLDAFKAFEAALRAKPSWKDAVKEYSALLNKYSRTKESCEVIQKAINLYPTDGNLYYLLGKSFLVQTDYESAVKSFEKAISLDNTNPSYYEKLIFAYEREQKYDEGLEVAEKGIELFPNNIKIMREKVHLLFSAKKLNTGASVLKNLSELTTRDPHVKDLMGQYYICCDNKKNVALCFDKIRKLNPSYQNYLYNAAYRYIQVEKYEEAVKCLKVFSASQQKNPLPLIWLARIEEFKNNYEVAIEILKKALSMNPNLNLAKEGIARLTKKIEEAKNPIETQEIAEEITSEEQTEEVVDSENNVEEISEPEVEPVAEIETEIKSEDDFNLDDFTDLILENDEKIDPFAIEEEDMFDDFMDEDLFNDDLDDEAEEENPLVEEADIFADEKSPDLPVEEISEEPIDSSIEELAVPEDEISDVEEFEEIPEVVDENDEVSEMQTEDFEETEITEEINDSQEIVEDDKKDNTVQKIFVPDTSKMETLLEKAEQQANKAITSAEKAWQAAQNAADAAQSASCTEGYINQIAEETVQKVAADIEQKIQDAIELLQSQFKKANETVVSENTDDSVASENIEKQEELEEVENSDAVANRNSAIYSTIYNLLNDKNLAEKYSSEIGLFEKLYSMKDYLPDDKKEEFMKSETRLLLEFLINNLSGKPGIFAISETLRKSGMFAGEYSEITPESQSLSGKELVYKVFGYIKDLIKDIEDKNLAESMQNYINKLLTKLGE